jgi:seryl-tRNA synthetase
MLDIKFIAENPDIVKKAIHDKQTEPVDIDHLLALYEERKKLRQELDEINAARNVAAKEQNVADGKKFKELGATLEKKLHDLEKEYVPLLLKIPNVPSADTPVDSDESANKIMRQWGEMPQFSFEPKAHWDLGKALGIIESESAAEVSGARFTYLKGDLARMQFALLHYALEVLGDTETLQTIADEAGVKVTITPFVPVIPPVMMRTAVMNRMARLHPMDERYVFEKDDLVLIGSAEHTLGPLHMDETLPEEHMPIRYVGYSTAFRREAGAAGKDTRGILRQHQFDKIEIESFTLPEHSLEEQNFIIGIQEYLMRKLKLPYQVILKCTMDQGAPNYRGIDIETWMPGQNTYRETHSSDLMNSYQARRLNTRVKRADGTIEHVHMNDATVFAMGRTLIAIMENYQNEDGSIRVPEVLQKYMLKDVITKA